MPLTSFLKPSAKLTVSAAVLAAQPRNICGVAVRSAVVVSVGAVGRGPTTKAEAVDASTATSTWRSIMVRSASRRGRARKSYGWYCGTIPPAISPPRPTDTSTHLTPTDTERPARETPRRPRARRAAHSTHRARQAAPRARRRGGERATTPARYRRVERVRQLDLHNYTTACPTPATYLAQSEVRGPGRAG